MVRLVNFIGTDYRFLFNNPWSPVLLTEVVEGSYFDITVILVACAVTIFKLIDTVDLICADCRVVVDYLLHY